MVRLGAFTKNNLNKQGFRKLDDEAKSRYALALRFTPVVGTALIVIGLALQSPNLAWVNGTCHLKWGPTAQRHVY